MIFMTRLIRNPLVVFRVGQFHEDGTITAQAVTGEIVHLNRFDIETPRMCCPECGVPVIYIKDKTAANKHAECPEYAKHMWQNCYKASYDTKKFNRTQRRSATKQAVMWLNRWKATKSTNRLITEQDTLQFQRLSERGFEGELPQ